jgi:hypothetical protein
MHARSTESIFQDVNDGGLMCIDIPVGMGVEIERERKSKQRMKTNHSVPHAG